MKRKPQRQSSAVTHNYISKRWGCTVHSLSTEVSNTVSPTFSDLQINLFPDSAEFSH